MTAPSVPKSRDTLTALVRNAAEDCPDQLAYRFLVDGETEEATLTYAQLEQSVRAVASMLQDAGLAPGDRALLLYPPGLEYLIGFFGCLYAGVIAVPAYPPDPGRLGRTLPRILAIIADSGASAVMTTEMIALMRPVVTDLAPALGNLKWVTTDAAQSEMQLRASLWQPRWATSSDVAFLQYTSGSTGTPKGVILTHGNLIHNSEVIHRGFGSSRESQGVGWLPPYHDMGLIGTILQPLYVQFPVTLMSPLSFLQKPMAWMRAISRFKGTISGGPNFAYDLCVRRSTQAERDDLDLSHWTVAFNGAEAVRQETIDRFFEAFESAGLRREAHYPCYGLAEGTLMVTGAHPLRGVKAFSFNRQALGTGRGVLFEEGGEPSDRTTLVSSGVVMLEQKLRIVDPKTLHSCADGMMGEIWVSGPSVAKGYWERAEETNTAFNAYVVDTGEGPFLRTGDLGFLRDGELFVTGRLKDLVIIRGRNHYPQDLESTVESAHWAVRPGCVAAFAVQRDGVDRLVVVAEFERRHRPDRRLKTATTHADRRATSDRRHDDFESKSTVAVAPDVAKAAQEEPEVSLEERQQQVIEAIRQSLSEEHGLPVSTIVLIKGGTIPKTSSGKIQRHATKTAFLENALEIVSAWRDDRTNSAAPGKVSSVAPPTISSDGFHSVEEATAWLRPRFARLMGVSSKAVDVHAPITRYGIDSLRSVELLNEIESVTGVSLAMSSILRGPTLVDLATELLAASAGRDQEPIVSSGTNPVVSAGQRALWFFQRAAPDSLSYSISRAVWLGESTDLAALRAAFGDLVERHESLRTLFVDVRGEPEARVQSDSTLEFILEDATGWDDQRVRERFQSLASIPFDLSKGPLCRVRVLAGALHGAAMLFSIHHIVTDFWSLAVMLRELAECYSARAKGKTPQLSLPGASFSDVTRWQQATLAGERSDTLWRYWSERLSGDLPVLALPTDRARPAARSERGGTVSFQLSHERLEQLRRIARENGSTLYVTLLSLYAAFLARHTGQNDVIIGTPFALRSRAAMANVVGYLINTLPLRIDLSGHPSLAGLMKQVRQTVHGAFANHEMPLSEIVTRRNPERDGRQMPLFQTAFVLQQTPTPDLGWLTGFALDVAGTRGELGDLHIAALPLEQTTSQFDLALYIAEGTNALGARFEYDADIFDRATVARLAQRFASFVEHAAAAASTQSLESLPLLAGDEQSLLSRWNETARAHVSQLAVHAAIEAQAARTPEAIALIADDRTLTYADLNAEANRLARRLKALGVGADQFVGVMMERSADLVVALIATLKAGGAYLPIDPAYPKERLQYVVQDSGVRVVLTQQSLVGHLQGAEGVRVVAVDAESERNEARTQPAANLNLPVQPGQSAYMIYTSGSTGRPKGVMVTHANVHNFFAGMDERLGTERGTWLALTSISFDISVLELFWTLSRGYKVVLGRGADAKPRPATPKVDFSVFFFNAEQNPALHGDTYRLVLETAKFADRSGFTAVWVPERHFHAFGGVFPNPSVVCAGIATITTRVKLRAGSVVIPLHEPIRVAEEWSVVDNLSGGRVELSFASGWHANDFALAPSKFKTRRDVMAQGIETVRKLWRGEAIDVQNGVGETISIRTLPRPKQPELPFWVTAAGNPDTFRIAGEMGGMLLTHLLEQNVKDLGAKLAIYREAWRKAGHPGTGRVCVMVHTFIGATESAANEIVQKPFRAYLKTAASLMAQLANASGLKANDLTPDNIEMLVDRSYDRLYHHHALFGTPESCETMVRDLAAIGVDEIGCLVDFGIAAETVLANYTHLEALKQRFEVARAEVGASVPATVLARGVTHLQCTPSQARMILAEQDGARAIGALRTMMLGGEALPPALAEEILGAMKAGANGSLENMYGPTETTVWSTTDSVANGEITLGRPIVNTQVHVVNERLEHTPIGVAGELLIGGDGVTRGYHTRASLTADRFVPDPFSKRPGARLYRTGDLARWRSDGRLEYLGRMDFQVKVRGHRIELGEIEAALGAIPGIGDCAVLALQEQGEMRLAAYYATKSGSAPVGAATIRETLTMKLPAYMVPGTYVPVEKMPRTPNGKLDRKRLPSAAKAERLETAQYIAPRNEVEQKLAGVLAHVLKVERVGVLDNFFSLGGNSIQTITVVARARDVGVQLSARAIVECQTIGAIAERLETQRTAALASEERPAALFDEATLATLRSANPDLEDAYPLAPAQLGMLLQSVRDSDARPYLQQLVLELRGPVDADTLALAWKHVIGRHPILRTTFEWDRVQPPAQIVHSAVNPEFVVYDAPVDREQLLREDRERGLDPGALPATRLMFVRESPDRSALVWTYQHFHLDAWSLPRVVAEVFECYASLRSTGRPAERALPPPYRRFIEWVRRQDVASAERFFRDQLFDVREPTVLPIDSGRNSGVHVREDVRLTTDETRAIVERARAEAVTPATIAHLALAITLGRYASSTDVVFGTVMAGRPESLPGAADIIGVTLNTLPLRVRLDGTGGLTEWLRDLHRQQAELQERAYVTLSDVQRWSGIRPPRQLFECGIAFENLPIDHATGPGLDVEVSHAELREAIEFPLFLRVDPTDAWSLSLEYDTGRFTAADAARFLGHFRTVLAAIANRTQREAARTLMRVSLLDAEETAKLAAWNNSARAYERGSITSLFDAQAARTPDAIAVQDKQRALTYRQLQDDANRLAHALIDRGVEREERVGVCIERGVDMLVALLAVMKAGGAYVPIDPEYPDARSKYIAQDSRVRFVLTQRTMLAGLARKFSAQLVAVDAEIEARRSAPASHIDRVGSADQIAYMIYTSGSTGQPKGVMVTHANVRNLFAGMDARLGNATGTWLALTSISFDISVVELFWTLSRGCRVIVGRSDFQAGAAEWVLSQNVTHLQCTPSQARLILSEGNGARAVGALQKLMVAGEALPPALATDILGILGSGARGSLDNLYGPTETCVYSSGDHVTDADVTLGGPVANTQLYVVDSRGELTPIGVPGELLIGGDGVSRGYHARPGLTAERFIPDPFSGRPGARLYRTGDLVRWRADGRLEYLGRIDFQVKIRGHRIELGEIETAIGAMAGIADCAVVARGTSLEDVRLVAFYSSKERGNPVPPSTIRETLNASLPAYMVPTAFIALDEMPRTPNGKLDRKALPTTDTVQRNDRVEYVAPRSASEETIAAVWQKVLRVDRVGVNDNFFDLGGTSLLILTLRRELSAALRREFSVVEVLSHPNVEALAKVVDDARSSGEILVESKTRGAARSAQLLQQSRRRK